MYKKLDLLTIQAVFRYVFILTKLGLSDLLIIIVFDKWKTFNGVVGKIR